MEPSDRSNVLTEVAPHSPLRYTGYGHVEFRLCTYPCTAAKTMKPSLELAASSNRVPRIYVWSAAIAAGLGLRLLLAAWYPMLPIPAGARDASYYLETACSIAAGHGYSYAGMPTSYFPAAIPPILAYSPRLAGAPSGRLRSPTSFLHS